MVNEGGGRNQPKLEAEWFPREGASKAKAGSSSPVVCHAGGGISSKTSFAPGRGDRRGSSLARILAAVISGWDTSASKATLCCVSCWWKRGKSSSVATRTGDVSSCTWRFAATVRSPRWRWRASWRSASTGCGARDGITSRFCGSVRTQGSP